MLTFIIYLVDNYQPFNLLLNKIYQVQVINNEYKE